MSTTVTPSAATLLQVSIASTFTTIGQRTNISLGGFKVGTDKITHLDSVGEEKRPSIFDAGTLKCQFEWLGSDATHQFLMTNILAPATLSWKLILSVPTHGTWAFSGHVIDFALSGMDEGFGHVLADIEIDITGVPTFS